MQSLGDLTVSVRYTELEERVQQENNVNICHSRKCKVITLGYAKGPKWRKLQLYAWTCAYFKLCNIIFQYPITNKVYQIELIKTDKTIKRIKIYFGKLKYSQDQPPYQNG